MSVSVSIVNNKHRRFESYLEIGEATAEIKAYLKSLKGSNYLVDRRMSAEQQGDGAKAANSKHKTQSMPQMLESRKQKPIGQILLEARIVTEDRLNEALKKHLESNKKLGEILIEMGIVSPEQIGKSLAKQYNISEVTSDAFDINTDISEIIPENIMRELKVFPVAKRKNRINVAMVNPFDEDSKQKLEKLTGHQIHPLFILEEELNKALKRKNEIQS